MAGEQAQSVEASLGRRLFVEEFLVDFLGGLVPGVLFFVAATFALLPPFHSLSSVLVGKTPALLALVAKIFGAFYGTPNTFWIAFFLGATLLAYIIGHLFYRHDVKKADRKSFHRLEKEIRKTTKKNYKRIPEPKKTLEETITENLQKNLGCSSENDCEFPYPYFDEYLKQRGLTHLVPFVTWSNNRERRSKTYVNILKIRLRHSHPEKCGAIIRNEAHVRLGCSTWYVALLTMWISGLGFIVSLVALGFSLAQLDSVSHLSLKFPSLTDTSLRIRWLLAPDTTRVFSAHLPSLLSPGIVFVLSFYSRLTIQGFLHYQRLREVFFVLETAYSAFREKFVLLDPPFSELTRRVQKQMQNGCGEVEENGSGLRNQ